MQWLMQLIQVDATWEYKYHRIVSVFSLCILGGRGIAGAMRSRGGSNISSKVEAPMAISQLAQSATAYQSNY